MGTIQTDSGLQKQFDLLQKISEDIKEYHEKETIEPEQYDFLIQASLAMVEIAKVIS